MIDKLVAYIDAKIEYEFLRRDEMSDKDNLFCKTEDILEAGEKVKLRLEELESVASVTQKTLGDANALVQSLGETLGPLVNKLRKT